MSNEKERLSLRASPVTSYQLHTAYRKSVCRSSMNELAEKAIGFYLAYLKADNSGDFLPTALKFYVDGRLGKLEERLSSLSFRQSVKVDMMAGILADGFQFSEEDLRRRRAESVNNVKRTDGPISLEKYARDAWKDEGEWQDGSSKVLTSKTAAPAAETPLVIFDISPLVNGWRSCQMIARQHADRNGSSKS